MNTTKLFLLFTGMLFFLTACKTNLGIFSAAKTPHEQYAANLEKAGLHTTTLGQAWLTAAENSLKYPDTISLPYLEAGYFTQDQPQSAGYLFPLRRGEKVKIRIETIPENGFLLFAELWEPRANNKLNFLIGSDSSTKSIEHEASSNGNFILRVQTELLQNVEFKVHISTAPSIAYPVIESANPKIQSFWGAGRDGGARKHEGVDIFAKRNTPLVAVADGTINRVGNNNLGGKVIFLRPKNKDYRLYYAHLDSQLVQSGQQVKLGDTIGLMGNTGNARTTAPHLHFGIYTRQGAVDPLPYIDRFRKEAEPIKADTKNLMKWMRVQQPTNVFATASSNAKIADKLETAEIVKVIGVTANYYKVISKQQISGFIPAGNLTTNSWKQQTIKEQIRILHSPNPSSPGIAAINPDTLIQILGKQGVYFFVSHKDKQGWINEADL